jgi:MFS family permease
MKLKRGEQAVLLGPAIAPFIGGFAAHYSSWRILQAAIGLVALLVFFILTVFLPETSHPGERGVDKVNLAKRKGKATSNTDGDEIEEGGWGARVKDKLPVLLNPFAPLWLLKSPNLLFVVRYPLRDVPIDWHRN